MTTHRQLDPKALAWALAAWLTSVTAAFVLGARVGAEVAADPTDADRRMLHADGGWG